MEVAATVFLLLLVGVAMVITASIDRPASKPSTRSDSQKEGFRYDPSNFLIYNYFPSTAIGVSAIPDGDSAKEVTLIKRIEPLRTGGLNRNQVLKYLKGGNILRFYVYLGGKNRELASIGLDPERKVHFSDYQIDTEKNERVKALHVGMITSRFILTSTDSLNLVTTAGNALGGNAWVKIHNLTNLPLRLNDDIRVEPHSAERYLGYLDQGISLGYWFKDQDRLYPDFQYLEPQSDVYYGVISDLRQPLQGCAQLEFNDECDYGQTMWPFQEGVM